MCSSVGRVIRGAFDIGSGATKLSVAVISYGEDGSATLLESLFESQTEVLYGHDAKKNSTTNCLSQEILDHGFKVLESYCNRAMTEFGCISPLIGVATAVFRETKNGEAFLKRVQDSLPLRIHLVSQEEEGLLGFQTATAVSQLAASDILSWDSGGASFQLVRLRPDRGHLHRAASPSDCQVYLGCLGSSKVTAMMVEQVQHEDFTVTQSPNPVSSEDARALGSLIAQAITAVPEWWDAQLKVVAIGGVDCMAAIASTVVGSCDITQEGLDDAIQRLCGKTDEELSFLPQPQMVLPKLVLMRTVMSIFDIRLARYSCANGSNPAILVSHYYASDGQTGDC